MVLKGEGWLRHTAVLERLGVDWKAEVESECLLVESENFFTYAMALKDENSHSLERVCKCL